MKRILLTISAILIAGLITFTLFFKISSLARENSRLLNNQERLLSESQIILAENQKYRVADSINAVRVSELALTLAEYKKYRSADLELIKQLKAGKSDLQKVVSAQAETISRLQTELRDSVTLSPNSQVDTLKCFSYNTTWTSLEGCINLRTDTLDIQVNNREDIKIVETITYKRFLGFLWKTGKIKSKQVNVVSKNPNTSIINCEYISIER